MYHLFGPRANISQQRWNYYNNIITKTQRTLEKSSKKMIIISLSDNSPETPPLKKVCIFIRMIDVIEFFIVHVHCDVLFVLKLRTLFGDRKCPVQIIGEIYSTTNLFTLFITGNDQLGLKSHHMLWIWKISVIKCFKNVEQIFLWSCLYSTNNVINKCYERCYCDALQC